MTSFRRSKIRCAICGVREATTRDHVPPKAVFHRPLPTDLITVPACNRCNNEGSKYDEKLRVFVSLWAGIDTPRTYSFWKNQALRTLVKNRKLNDQLVEKTWKVDLRSPSGIYVGDAYAVGVPARSLDAAIERIVRGLYFHHFGEAIGSRGAVRVQPLRTLPPGFAEQISNWPAAWVGDKTFYYRFARTRGAPLESLWILLFYERFCVFGQTRAK
jgi:hypothetical protein